MGWGTNASLWGLEVSGDIGALSVYTDRFGKKVAYPKSPPKEPASPLQIQQRTRFRLAQAEWSQQTDEVKADLEALVDAASLCMTGQNLWVHTALRDTFAQYITLQTQTGITVPLPTYQPFVTL